MTMLKGQDIIILLKLAADNGKRQSYARLAADLVMSPSEAHAGVMRLAGAGLVDAERKKARIAGVTEFLRHGLKYVGKVYRSGKRRKTSDCAIKCKKNQ